MALLTLPLWVQEAPASGVSVEPARDELSPNPQSIDTRVEGLVTDMEGEPVVGATVTLVAEGMDEGIVLKTGDDGSFSKLGLLPHAYVLRVEAEGYEALEQEVAPRPGLLMISVTLQSLAAIDAAERRAEAARALDHGRFAFELGDYRAAIGAMQEVLELLPEADPETDGARAAALSVLANSYLAQNRLDEALQAFERFLELEPDHVGTHLSIGHIHARRNHRSRAIAAFRKALEVDPASPKAHFNLAVVLLTPADGRKADARETDAGEAVEHLLLVLEAAPLDAGWHRNVGEQLLDLGVLEEGVAALERALVLEPELAVDRRELGWAYAALDEPARAVEQFRLYLQDYPEAPDAEEIGAAIHHLEQRRPSSPQANG